MGDKHRSKFQFSFEPCVLTRCTDSDKISAQTIAV